VRRTVVALPAWSLARTVITSLPLGMARIDDAFALRTMRRGAPALAVQALRRRTFLPRVSVTTTCPASLLVMRVANPRRSFGRVTDFGTSRVTAGAVVSGGTGSADTVIGRLTVRAFPDPSSR
jgi:hypothetical protein